MEDIITCIILNYNDAPTTVSLINSIRNYKTINYIIVVDNKSTDDSVPVLKKCIDEKVIFNRICKKWWLWIWK
jgi:N-acetylglucosaminyl-diphospho-decaprenol L-rhamnosyltransferase